MKPKLLVCLGDSITYGYPFGPGFSWVKRLQRRVPFTLINRGVNGDTTGDMLYRFKSDVVAAGATHVHLLGGINDAWLGFEMERSLENVQRMIQMSREHDIIPILGLTTPLCDRPASGGSFFVSGTVKINNWLVSFRNGLREIAAAESVMLVDYCTPLSLPGMEKGDPRFFYDEAHPNEDGYQKLADVAESKL